PGLLQGGAVELWVDAVERARDAEADGAGLAGRAAPVDADQHVVGAVELESGQRVVDDLLVDLVREELLERPAVDLPLAGARDDPDAGDGLLAAARAGAGSRGGGALHGRVGGDRALGLGRVGAQLGLIALEHLGRHRVFGGISHGIASISFSAALTARPARSCRGWAAVPRAGARHLR